jgi:ribosomal protein S18 acetylase RimI-like enzyme
VNAAGVGDIALFGVAMEAQGRGAGQRLLASALSWFAARAQRVEVKTQAINYPAAKMYERGGFRLCRSDLTYGRRLSQ